MYFIKYHSTLPKHATTMVTSETQGISCFIVEMDTFGVEMTRPFHFYILRDILFINQFRHIFNMYLSVIVCVFVLCY